MGKKAGGIAKRAGIATLTGGLSEFAQKNPYGVPMPNNPIRKALGLSDDQKTTLDGEFSISPEELNASTGAILNEGKTQSEMRGKRRQELADLLYKSQDRIFRDNYPQIAEDANSKGLYTGTGFSEALAREKSRLAADTTDALSQQALGDLDAELGFRNNALSRRFSLEDFIRSANVAKNTGLALQPKSDGKAGTGAILQGVGALGKGVPGFMSLFASAADKKKSEDSNG